MKKAITLNLILSLLVICVAASFSFAQTVYTPSKNSAERRDIIEALKAKTDTDGKNNAMINPSFFKVSGVWAYLQGLPKRNSTVEQYARNVKALLRKIDGKWTVVKYLIGSGDLEFFGWDKEFNAPNGIFPKAVRASGKGK